MSEPEREVASQRNRRLVHVLLVAGKSAGLDVTTEYPVVGGRIDVVWFWEGGPGFPIRLPLVGFEIESSWRTRKHIKGDLLNLIDLQPALGVIVLAGQGAKIESTRQFARSMVARHAPRMEVWDEARVDALVAGEPGAVQKLMEDLPAVAPSSVSGRVRVSKYDPLTEWLKREARDEIETSFGEIEELLGFPLPPSSRRHVAHWHGSAGSVVAEAIRAAGWRAHNVDLHSERLDLRRASRIG